MANSQTTERLHRHYLKVVAFAVLGMMVGATLTWSIPHTVVWFFGVTDSDMSEAEMSAVATVAEPIALRVPSVGIATTFSDPLGLNPDQTIAVPDSYDTVGIYKYGPRPGALGPAVVLGHVDSYQGPAVFHPLHRVRVGDEVAIDRADGTTAIFMVTRLLHRAQSDFPTAEVYGDLDYAGLRLITCSGTFDQGQQTYSHNLIVFARLERVEATTL